MSWVKISLILCMFGCLKEFRPSESFITDYLTGPWKNFTVIQVNEEIYPIGTYSNFATLILIFLVTDFVRYKPIIILCGLSGAITFTIIVLGKTVFLLEIVEFFYGLFLSCEVAYYTYIYAKVDKKHYQEVTGHTKAAALIGRCLSGIIAQLTASLNLLDYHQLNYLTISAHVLATVWALFLPSVGQSIYFHRSCPVYDEAPISAITNEESVQRYDTDHPRNSSQQNLQKIYPETNSSLIQKVKQAYYLLWKDFVQAYTNFHVIKWSVWCALSSCGFLQVSAYIQLLWQTAVKPGDPIYNGAVDSLYTIIGAATVFAIGNIPLNWLVIGDASVSIVSFLEGALLLILAFTYNIWIQYAGYIIFGILHQTMFTVASFEVAKNISEDSYGLIFGVNTFFGLLLQSILTAVVLNGSLHLDIRNQYVVYGGCFIVIAVVFTIITVFTIISYYRRGEDMTIWIKKKDALEKACNTDNRSTRENPI